MKKWIVLLLVCSVSIATSTVFAAESLTQNFRKVAKLDLPAISSPRVVEIVIPSIISSEEWYLVEDTTQSTVGFRTSIITTSTQKSTYSITSNGKQLGALSDHLVDTTVQFAVSSPNIPQQTQLSIEFPQPQTVSQILFSFAKNSQKPDNIMIQTIDNSGNTKILLNTVSYSNPTLKITPEKVTNLKVILEHQQPLTISDVLIPNDDQQTNTTSALRFLAAPDTEYRLYTQPANTIAMKSYPEVGDVFKEKNPIKLNSSTLDFQDNPDYKPSDTDQDGISDSLDNCPSVANPEQKDENSNLKGDVCDDTDFDSVINASDNCISTANSNQADRDADGIGDACDDQESRFTEKYNWLVWLAMGVTLTVILGLNFVFIKDLKKKIKN